MAAPLSLMASVFLVIASMLGSGILTTTGSIVSLVKSPVAVVMVWLLAGGHALVGAYCYGQIVRRVPENGGEASILRRFFSPALGEIAGWVSFIVGFAASNAASAIGFGAYLGKALPASAGALSVTGGALLAIVMVTLLHSVTGPFGIRIQTGMAMLKFGMLVGLAVWGVSQMPGGGVMGGGGVWGAEALGAMPGFGSAWGLAIMFSMFAYLGWSAAIYSAAETRDAKRTVPRAMLLGSGIVLLLYVTVNVALLRHIPLGELAGEKAVLEVLVRKLFGAGASSVFSGVVAFALLSSLGASAFLGPRVLHAMLRWRGGSEAREEKERVEPEGAKAAADVPARFVWLQAALSMAMIVSGTFEQILTVTGFLLGIFPMLAVLGLYGVRANQTETVSRMVLWGAAPLFLSGSLLILGLGALERPGEMGIASGLVVLLFWLRRGVRQPSMSLN